MFNHLILRGAAGTRVSTAPVADSDLSQLRELAGQVLTGVVVLIVIAALVSVVLFVIGKFTQLSKAQAASMLWSLRIFLGASIVGSVGGLVFWGSGLGGTNLMPEGARPGVVEITKNPAKTTCTNELRLEDPAHLSDLSKEERTRYAQALLKPEDAAVVANKAVVRFVYIPQGPDCTSANMTPDSCSDVKVLYDEDDPFTRFDPRNSSECKN